MKYLIVNADDLGLDPSINEGIIRGHSEGIVTALQLMAAGDAFDDAVRRLKEAGVKEIGAHLTLTGMRPVTDAAKIDTLIGRSGRLRANHISLLARLFLKKINPAHIYTELKGQLEILSALGLPIANISSHENIHMAPQILRVFVRLAKEYRIPTIRYPHAERLTGPLRPKKVYKKTVLAKLEKGMSGILRSSGLRKADHFLGFLDAGKITEGKLIGMLSSLADGVTELVTHPGFLSPAVVEGSSFHRNCETELAALTSRRVKAMLQSEKIKLISYGELNALKP